MGPVLYTIYATDLPEMYKNTMATFADDIDIFAINKNPDIAAQNMQRALDEIAADVANKRQ